MDDVFAKVPIGELTLAEAEVQVDDPSFFYETMAPVVYHFQHCITPESYWDLRMDHHNLIVAWLDKTGRLNGDS